jgi:hypothetical protein
LHPRKTIPPFHIIKSTLSPSRCPRSKLLSNFIPRSKKRASLSIYEKKYKREKQNVIFGCDKVLIVFFSFFARHHFSYTQRNLSSKKNCLQRSPQDKNFSVFFSFTTIFRRLSLLSFHFDLFLASNNYF